MKNLTAAQKRALEQVAAEGTVYAYNGISISTAHALAARGLVKFTSRPVSTRTTRTGRTCFSSDWTITAI